MFTRLIKQLLEVRNADPVVAAHGGDRRSDAYAGEFVTDEVDLFGTCRDQAHRAADMGEDIRVEQLDEERVQIGVDKARLRQQPLRCRLVVGIGVRREVFLDLDPLTHFHATPRMDRQALQVQKDLDLVLGQLDS